MCKTKVGIAQMVEPRTEDFSVACSIHVQKAFNSQITFLFIIIIFSLKK